MRRLCFTVVQTVVRGSHDAAYLAGDEDLAEALADAVLQNLSTNLELRISGVSMFLAAWLDPDHWATDWAETLGVNVDDAPAAVNALLATAVEDDRGTPPSTTIGGSDADRS